MRLLNRDRAGAVNLLLAGLAVVAILATLEGSARLLRLRKGFFLVMTERDCMQRSVALGFELRPSCEAVREKGTTYRVNRHGLRSPELREDGAPRILALGDSSTWGWGVTQEDSYPYVLQRLLDDRHGDGAYEVINAGRPAWTSYQGRVWFEEQGILLRPLVLILSFAFNDATPGGDDEERIVAQARWVPLLLADDFLLDRSRFYSWLRWQFVSDPDPSPRVSREKYRRNMASMIDLARGKGAHVLLLAFPSSKPDLSEYLAVLEDLGRVWRVPLVTYRGPRFDPVHPTAEGHRKLAGELAAQLDSEGYLPSFRPRRVS